MIEKSLFWELHTPQQNKPSVIFGTLHLGCDEVSLHWDKTKALIQSYNRVFTESPLDKESNDYSAQFALLGEEHVYDYISPRRWRKMRTTFKKYLNVDIDQMKMLRPLFIMSMLQVNLMKANGQAIDHRIWKFAEANHYTVNGIESAQEQVDILLQLSTQQHFRQLVAFSKNISKTRKSIKRLLKLYADEDIHALYKKSKGSLGVDKATLLNDRNVIMSDRIFNYHEEHPSFFSFGAGHLAGFQGVLQLLKAKGATLQPI